MYPPDLFDVLFIPLSRGKFACIDQKDWPLVAGFSWYAMKVPHGKTFYAQAYARGSGRACETKVKMHRVIAGAQAGEEYDHENQDGLDNRRGNLRLCTRAQNLVNRPPMRGAKFHGVSPFRSGGFVAICDGKHLGIYATEEDAATAWDRAAEKRWGAFAPLNFPNRKDHPKQRLTQRATKTGYRGVGLSSRGNRFNAVFGEKHLGSFVSAEDAARAYDRAAFAKYGDARRCNFPHEFTAVTGPRE